VALVDLSWRRRALCVSVASATSRFQKHCVSEQNEPNYVAARSSRSLHFQGVVASRGDKTGNFVARKRVFDFSDESNRKASNELRRAAARSRKQNSENPERQDILLRDSRRATTILQTAGGGDTSCGTPPR
jgi:hypothetical protein